MSIETRSPENPYAMVEELIRHLRRDGATKLATVLDHRLHKVAWTTSSELLGELQAVLEEAKLYDDRLTDESRVQIARALARISSLLER